MTQNFAFPVVGWLRDLSAGARQEIGRRFPTLPADRISSEAGWYVIMRDANHPAPDEARKMLVSLQGQARQLFAALQPSAIVPAQRLYRTGPAGLIQSPVGLADLRTALLYFDIAFSKAITFIPAGRRRSPRERLVRSLANILLESGETIDAKPQGVLCRLVEIVLLDVEEAPTDVRKIVQPVVRAMENSKKKAGTFSKKAC